MTTVTIEKMTQPQLPEGIEWNKVYSVGLDGLLTNDTKRHIEYLIRANYNLTQGQLSPLITSNEWDNWLDERKGTYTKRLANWLYKSFQIKISPEHLSAVGNIASKDIRKRELYFSFASECDWKPGNFGEESQSCWWHSYNHARLGLFQNGGFAIKFYHTNALADVGLGRAWIFPDDGKYYLFNPYSINNQVDGYSMSRVVSHLFGMSYRHLSRLFGEGAFINGDQGYVIGRYEEIQEMREFTMDFSLRSECHECKRVERRNNMRHVYIRKDRRSSATEIVSLCSNCHYHSSLCSHCGDRFANSSIEDTERFDGGKLCTYCASRYYKRCKECQKWHRNANSQHPDLCRICIENHTCHACGNFDGNTFKIHTKTDQILAVLCTACTTENHTKMKDFLGKFTLLTSYLKDMRMRRGLFFDGIGEPAHDNT